MIFISGVHGVGKTYFCDMVRKELGIKAYPASRLITEKKKAGFDSNKLVSDIDENQQYLLVAVDELRQKENNFILDGHFCLLDTSGTVTRIGIDTFTSLKPEAIILLTEKPVVISQRRKERDGKEVSPESIDVFQTEEQKYAEEVAAQIGAQLFVSKGSEDLPKALDFIKSL